MKKKNRKSSAKTQSPAAASAPKPNAITASVKVLPVPPGLFMFSVKAGAPGPVATKSGGLLRLPALQVGVGPGTPHNRVEFISGNSAVGPWLSRPGDLLVTKVNAPGATLVLTSMRDNTGAELSIRFERLVGRDGPVASPQAPIAAPVAPLPQPTARPDDGSLRARLTVHVRGRGDLAFDTPWAGRTGRGQWIESFSVTALQGLSPADVEYKGLTASGFESPWLSNGASCGTRGMAIPLVGFAFRAKAGGAAAEYDFEYSGYFQSGVTVGPLKNGAPCRSTVPNDPVEGIQLRVIKRAATKKSAPKEPQPPRPGAKGPSFGRFRENTVRGRKKKR